MEKSSGEGAVGKASPRNRGFIYSLYNGWECMLREESKGKTKEEAVCTKLWTGK